MEESTQEEAGSWQPQVRWWSRGWVVLALAAMAMLGFVIGRFAMRPEAAQTADKRQGLGIIQEAPIQKTPSGPPSPEVAPEPAAGAQAPAQQQPSKREKTRLSKGVRRPAVTAQRPHQHVPASPSPVEHQREAIRTSP
jgi:hypothetical protein